MGTLYDWFLWIIGFRESGDDKDTISAMLWRQKQRMGAWWWLMSIGTIVLTTIILGFQIWLLFHIIFLNPAKSITKRGRRYVQSKIR